MGCFVRGDKNSMGCYVRGDKNSIGCFVWGGKKWHGMFCPAPCKLHMTAIYSKWTFIFLNRNRLFVILNHVNSQNKTLFQLLSICCLSAILKSRISRCFKSRQISCQNTTLYPGKNAPLFPPLFWWESKARHIHSTTGTPQR